MQRVDAGKEDEDENDLVLEAETSPRYWSDFNRMYYVPRSVHSVQDLPEWEASSLKWEYGRRMFNVYNAVCFSIFSVALK